MENLTLQERFDNIEAQGFRYVYDGRGWFSGIWRNDKIDCILNYQGGSYETITEAVEAAERFINALARI